MKRSIVARVGALCVLSVHLAGAQADDADARARARKLADDAADLLEAHDYAAALDRATRAEALYHAPSNVVLIAQAEEGAGRLTAAVETYEKLVAEPLPAGAPQAFRAAQRVGSTRLRALVAHVPSMLISVRGVVGGDVTILVDGQKLADRGDAAVRFDPGPHQVSVSAVGYRPFERLVTLPARGGVTVVEANLVPLVAPPPPPPPQDTTVRPTIPVRVIPPPVVLPQAHVREKPSTMPAIVAFSVGGIGVIAGAVTGALSFAKVGDLKSACPGDQCPGSEKNTLDSARTYGTVSTVAFVAGGVGIVTGTVLLVVGRSHESNAAAAGRVSLTPWIGLGGAGVAGRF